MTRVLVTGVNRGIGLELAKVALENNAFVYGSVRSQEQAEMLRQKFPINFCPLVFDVTNETEIVTAIQRIESLDIIVNNAGVIGPDDQNTLSATLKDFGETFAVNAFAPLKVVQLCLPHLTSSNHPKIISISSQMSWMGYQKSDRIAYRASKAALNKIMQGLATDLAPKKIPVCVIDPGWVRTDMGGPDADNDVTEVAMGIWRVIKDLTMAQSGKFIRWTGEERGY